MTRPHRVAPISGAPRRAPRTLAAHGACHGDSRSVASVSRVAQGDTRAMSRRFAAGCVRGASPGRAYRRKADSQMNQKLRPRPRPRAPLAG
ncbi:hypothetical protein Bamb_5474 [Burkholderia ambifaria AMMD]|uniref:Uncharacterized protein n=1 Tax=Burkholderia ambifaria (strain ATCC BAA-244 / DSM 16087 / CCUG 44356 / LMG 19182 / AMMD) TaxID=339670 RepID=Q0B4A2_BURCM|nr:hypothetical protein Bamb_5474 [Burkholderia ambifaria AMMD]